MTTSERLQGQKQVLFTLEEPLFDETTYYGRFRAFQQKNNPLNAFFTNTQILEMKKLIDDQHQREVQQQQKTGDRRILLSEEEVARIRKAQTVVTIAIHPDTGKFIPWVCRLSSFLPCNIPISFGFIIAAPTPFNTIFWQWINQTYNALMNYGNRNATSNYTNEDIIKSYLVAVSSSIVVALAIRKALSGYTRHLTGSKLIVANSFSSFWACATAGYLNAHFMRRTELEKGIEIKDELGNIYGKSKEAAKRAVSQTANSRFFLAIPIFIPPTCLYFIEKKGIMPRNFYAKTALELSLIAFELYFAVPFAIGVYPQSGTIATNELEEEFRNLKNSRGEDLKAFIFNKGL